MQSMCFLRELDSRIISPTHATVQNIFAPKDQVARLLLTKLFNEDGSTAYDISPTEGQEEVDEGPILVRKASPMRHL